MLTVSTRVEFMLTILSPSLVLENRRKGVARVHFFPCTTGSLNLSCKHGFMWCTQICNKLQRPPGFTTKAGWFFKGRVCARVRSLGWKARRHEMQSTCDISVLLCRTKEINYPLVVLSQQALRDIRKKFKFY